MSFVKLPYRATGLMNKKWKLSKISSKRPPQDIILKRKKDELDDETHVFARRDHNLRKIFRKVSEACGLVYSQRSKDPTAWTIHDLRATALTHLLESGVDLATVSKKFAQHENLAETTRYCRPSKQAQERATKASTELALLAS